MIRILRGKNKEAKKKKIQTWKKSSSSSSDDEVEGGGSFINLSSEIIVEILCRLPVRSVLRCKSVCKLWHSLISHHPCFVYVNHRLIFSDTCSTYITICHVYDILYDKSIVGKVVEFDKASELRIPSSKRGPTIAASCNGLVCFLDYIDRMNVFIWNPSTRICSRRLSPGFRIDCYGFGYDKSSDDYKFFAKSSEETTSKSKIFSLKTGKWKKTGDFASPDYHVGNVEGKYLNGALHWLITPAQSFILGDFTSWKIITFDLATETYGQVSLPDQYGHTAGSFVSFDLGALDDQRLCVLCHFLGQNGSDIWVMKVKDSWTKLFSIPDCSGMSLCRWPLFISNDGKLLFEDQRRLILYDSKTGSFTEIQSDFYVNGKIFTYDETSLVSPHHQALRKTTSIQIKESIRAICKYNFGISN